jgi:hypothetical protein
MLIKQKTFTFQIGTVFTFLLCAGCSNGFQPLTSSTLSPAQLGSVAPPSLLPGSTPLPASPVSFVMAPHSPLPMLINNGGRILKTPKFKMITFQNEAWASPLEAFISTFATSAEFVRMTSEYGVGLAAALPPNRISEIPAASLADADVEKWLSRKLNDPTHPLGIADEEAIYVIAYPEATSITQAGASSCVDFAAYHAEYVDSITAKRISYAVIAHCSGDIVDNATASISHELAEAATDPDNDPAYYGVSGDFAIWETIGGGESGDLCEYYPSSFIKPIDIGFGIQRTWSNVAAAAGNDPCVPFDNSEVYFNSAPVLNDSITYTDPYIGTANIRTKGVSISIGQSKTVELHLFSNAPTSGAWTVSAEQYCNAASCTDLSFSFDKTTGVNGDVIKMTIKANSKDTTFNAEPFVIKSTLNGQSSYWLGIVGN